MEKRLLYLHQNNFKNMKKTLEIEYFLWYNFSAIRMCGDFDGIALYMSR